MKTKTLVPFLALTFGLTWGIAALLIFFNDQVVAIFGEITSSNPLFILAVYAPGFAGIFLVWRYLRTERAGKLFSAIDLMADAPGVVVVFAPGHSCPRLHCRRTEWYFQRSLSFFALGSGISSAGALLFPGYTRGVRLAGDRPASAAAQDGSLLG